MCLIKKNISLIVLAVAALAIGGCKKYEEEKFDFASTSKNPYVELKSKTAKTLTEGSAFSFIVQVRTAFAEEVTVSYAISGDFSLAGTMKIPANVVEASGSVTVPVGTVTGTNTSAAGTFKIISATRANRSLTVGRFSPNSEVISITVKK